MKSLRARLILSHILPLLLLAPLVGVTVASLLQVQQRLTAVSAQLTQQAQQIAQSTTTQPGIWTDDALAQLFVVEIVRQTLPSGQRVEVMLIRPGGQLLAASDPELAGQPLPEMQLVLQQEDGYLVLRAQVANVYVPVVRDEQVVGLVGLTQELDAVTARVLRLRFLLLAALAAELLLGIGLGLWLALRLERQLAAVTSAVAQVDTAGRPEKLPERGPREFQTLTRAYNGLVDRLQASEAARRQLLANTVHELARPLGALKSAVQALRYGADADQAFRQELLAGMDAQIERLQPLLNNLVELHGQVLGQVTLQRRPTPLAEWLRQVAAPWQAAALEKGVGWRLDVPDTLPEASIDPDRLAQAVGNLLSNAVKYTPAGGEVRLAAEGNGRLRVRVSDSGPGIAAAEQARIFEPLYRGQNGSRFPQGMGLGLPIARDLVRAHGGELTVESGVGAGSTFTIDVPVD